MSDASGVNSSPPVAGPDGGLAEDRVSGSGVDGRSARSGASPVASGAPVASLAPVAPAARGVARRIDHLGRIVIPAEYRKAFGIQSDDFIDMTVEGDAIVLRRLHPGCVLCDGVADLGLFRDRLLCASCVREIAAGSGGESEFRRVGSQFQS